MNASQLRSIIDTARVVSIPLRNRFRGVTEREALLFQGPQGWAEWAPFVEYEDEEAAVWLSAALEFASTDFSSLSGKKIGINATLPALHVSKVADALKPFGAFNTVKIKVAEPGQGLQDDLDRIAAVRALNPEAKIRLDANGAMSIDSALKLAELAGPIEYFEQPVRTIAEMAELRVRLKHQNPQVLIAADESVRKVSDPLAVVQAGAADILVLKAAPLGGITRATTIAREAGLPVVVSSALDTSVGISMGLHLAASIDDLSYDCGLGTAAMMIGDVAAKPLVAVDGKLEVGRVDVSENKLQVFEAEDHRYDWWLERLERVAKLI